MKKIKLIVLVLITYIILFSCSEDNKFDYPLVFTGNVAHITDTSAVFTAKISNFGNSQIKESGFIWGLYSHDSNGIKLLNEDSSDEMFSLQTNYKLLPGRTYYARAYVQTDNVKSYGGEVSFSIPGTPVEEYGRWAVKFNSSTPFGDDELVRCSFSINNNTYFIIDTDFGYGLLFKYNSLNNSFEFILSSAEIYNIDYSTVYNGIVYVFARDILYRFDPDKNKFIKVSVLNDSVRGVVGFRIDDNIYIGLGAFGNYSKNFWKYNITQNTWQKISPFPGDYRVYAYSFSFKNEAYVGGGYNLIEGQWPYPIFTDLWCYLPETDQWIQKQNLSISLERLNRLGGTNTNEFGYCFYENRLFEYNPIYNFWKEKDVVGSENIWYPHLFEEAGEVYLLKTNEYMENRYFKLWKYEK